MTYQPATSLPTGQKMALLMLRRTDLAEQILEHLREMSVPIPYETDWSALIEHGRAVKRNGHLALTPGGLYSAGIIMRDYARTLGIHSVNYAGGHGNQGPSATCTCGWGSYQPNNRSASVVLSRYATRHLEQAKLGTLPEAYTLPKFSTNGESNGQATPVAVDA